MFALHRIALPIINAFFITTGLLYIMFLMVNTQQPELLPKQKPVSIKWAKAPEDTPPPTIIKPPQPIPPEPAPTLVRDEPKVDIKIDNELLWTDYVQKQEPIKSTILHGNQLVLAIAFPPEYPLRQAEKGIEGYVVVGFSVASSGAVYDAFIIEAEPKGAFERSALKAIMKFKYKPKVVDGKPVNTEGLRYQFTYEMGS